MRDAPGDAREHRQKEHIAGEVLDVAVDDIEWAEPRDDSPQLGRILPGIPEVRATDDGRTERSELLSHRTLSRTVDSEHHAVPMAFGFPKNLTEPYLRPGWIETAYDMKDILQRDTPDELGIEAMPGSDLRSQD